MNVKFTRCARICLSYATRTNYWILSCSNLKKPQSKSEQHRLPVPPSLRIVANPTLLLQILNNLLRSNVYSFSTTARIRSFKVRKPRWINLSASIRNRVRNLRLRWKIALGLRIFLRVTWRRLPNWKLNLKRLILNLRERVRKDLKTQSSVSRAQLAPATQSKLSASMLNLWTVSFAC